MSHSLSRTTALLLGAAAICTAALAADKPLSAHARYQQDRAACMAGQTAEDKATCLYEAQSAYRDARRGALEPDGGAYDANARKRCEPLPLSDRLACLARMDGKGSTLGSVNEGGIYRELVVVETAVKPVPLAKGDSNKPAADE